MNKHIIEARKEYGKLSNLSKAQAKKGAFFNKNCIPRLREV